MKFAPAELRNVTPNASVRIARRAEKTGQQRDIGLRRFVLLFNRGMRSSTQSQSFNALLFVLRDVPDREMNFHDAERAKRPLRIPLC